MSVNPLDEILELAKSKSKMPEKPAQEHGEVDHDEWQDNEDMHGAGLTMGPTGNVNHGALKIGHVMAVPSKKGKYLGVHHPSGALTEPQSNKAKAALALMELHHYLPHKGDEKDHPGMALSNVLEANSKRPSRKPIAEIAVELAASEFTKKGIRSPEQGEKLYPGTQKWGDPKNKKYPLGNEEEVRAALGYINKGQDAKKYPLNGVTLSEVKNRIEAAARKLGIKVDGD
jgi:uncharacterized protein DUF6582